MLVRAHSQPIVRPILVFEENTDFWLPVCLCTGISPRQRGDMRGGPVLPVRIHRPLTELVALCATVWQKRGHTYKTRAYKMVDLPRACMGVKRGDVGVKIQAQVLNTCLPSQITHETGSVAWEPWRSPLFQTCNSQA